MWCANAVSANPGRMSRWQKGGHQYVNIAYKQKEKKSRGVLINYAQSLAGMHKYELRGNAVATQYMYYDFGSNNLKSNRKKTAHELLSLKDVYFTFAKMGMLIPTISSIFSMPRKGKRAKRDLWKMDRGLLQGYRVARLGFELLRSTSP